MCEFSQKLVAWLDRELSPEESAKVERHLEGCSECRGCVGGYKKVSGEFDAYCDAQAASRARRGMPRWMPAAAAAGAVALLSALFFATPRTPMQPPAFSSSPQTAEADSPAIVAAAASASERPAIHKVHRRQAIAPARIQSASAAPVQRQNAYYLPDEPVIQIAVPADDMFPPGAVPEGIHFVADFTLAPDGSAERLRLRPRLASFERRTTLP